LKLVLDAKVDGEISHYQMMRLFGDSIYRNCST